MGVGTPHLILFSPCSLTGNAETPLFSNACAYLFSVPIKPYNIYIYIYIGDIGVIGAIWDQ